MIILENVKHEKYPKYIPKYIPSIYPKGARNSAFTQGFLTNHARKCLKFAFTAISPNHTWCRILFIQIPVFTLLDMSNNTITPFSLWAPYNETHLNKIDRIEFHLLLTPSVYTSLFMSKREQIYSQCLAVLSLLYFAKFLFTPFFPNPN